MSRDGTKLMVELPEIARRRLSRAAASGDHPDAGLLTAFVEGTLARSHRDQVFNHLVACSDCNRLVALVAPPQEVAPAVQPVPASRGWFSWATFAPLRWAGAAAAVAVIVSAVWIARIDHPGRVPASPPVAVEKNFPPSMVAQLPPATAAASPRKPAADKRPQPRHELAKSAAAPTQPVTPPAVPEATFAESRPAVPGNVGDRSAFETSIITDSAPQSSLPPADAEPLHPRLKPEVAPAVQPSVPAPSAGAIGPVWSVSDSGVLQKSNDSGRSWAAVPVPTRSPLRVVSVMGQEIWVGGDGGALYHSSDGGQSWAAVTPVSDGKTLSTDIVRMAFASPSHGWIATRNGEIWITRDSGATWSVK